MMKARNVSMLLALAILGALATACGPDYDRTELTSVKPDPLGGGISVRNLEVHEGMILTSHIESWNDDREKMPIQVRSLGPDIVEVVPVVTPNDYTFIGRKAGKAIVEIVADEVVVVRIEAEVLAQPAPVP